MMESHGVRIAATKLPPLPLLAVLLLSAVFQSAALQAAESSEAAPPSASSSKLALIDASPIDLIFSEPTSVRDIYRAAGKALGVNVLFDPKLRDSEVVLVLEEVPAEHVFDRVASTAGHFYKVLDDKSLIIADDTPQNRRTYDDQHIQTFYLEHAELNDLMTVLRALIGVKHIAAHADLNALSVRDTVARTELAEALIQAHDKPTEVIEVAVEILSVDEQVWEASRSKDTAARLRLAPQQWQVFKDRKGVDSVTRTDLSSAGGSPAELKLGHRVPFPQEGYSTTAVPASTLRYEDVGLELTVTPKHHSTTGETSLAVELGLSYLEGMTSEVSPRPVATYRELRSEVRLELGETAVLSGLWSIETCGVKAPDFLTLLSPQPCHGLQRQPRHLVIALSPQVAQASSITARDRLPLAVGTEAVIVDPRPVTDTTDDESRKGVRKRLRERLLKRELNEASKAQHHE